MSRRRRVRSKRPLSEERIRAIFDRFANEDLRVDEAEREIARLRKSSERAIPWLVEMMRAPQKKHCSTAALLLEHLGDKRAIEPLLALLGDPRLDDGHKIEIFGVLRTLGAAVDEAAFFSSVRDPHAAMQQAMQDILDRLDDDLHLAMFVEMMQDQMPPKIQVAYIEDVARLGDPRAGRLFRALLHSENNRVVMAAIRGLEQISDASAVATLEELAQYGSSKRIRREAAKVAGHLTMRASASQTRVRQAIQLPIHRCLLTTIDGSGGQMAWIIRRRPDDRLKMANFMFNDHEGLKDCIGADSLNEDEVDALLDMMESSGIVFVDVRLERCQEALARARQVALAAGRRLPPQYEAWTDFIAGDDPRDIEEVAMEEVDIEARPELVEECGELLMLDEFEAWFFEPAEWKGHAKAVRALGKVEGAVREQKESESIRQGLEAIVDDERRRLLRERLRRQGWVLAQLYEDEEVWQWAMAAAAALEDDSSVPLHQHPLLVGMMQETLELEPGQSAIWRG